jgi:hypothetical protein
LGWIQEKNENFFHFFMCLKNKANQKTVQPGWKNVVKLFLVVNCDVAQWNQGDAGIFMMKKGG